MFNDFVDLRDCVVVVVVLDRVLKFRVSTVSEVSGKSYQDRFGEERDDPRVET